MPYLPNELVQFYKESKDAIQKRLQEFENVPKEQYFYELCYCLCTPQSSAINAEKVVNKLFELDFRNNNFNPAEILASRKHYIRFHNQKAQRLLEMKSNYKKILKILEQNDTAFNKRELLVTIVKGFGYKESSHFLRNIGYKNLAIIDRHLLKNLLKCNVISEIPKNINKKKYLEIEERFLNFSQQINIPLDELDLLFWSYETGLILK